MLQLEQLVSAVQGNITVWLKIYVTRKYILWKKCIFSVKCDSLSLSLSLSIYIYIYIERERERERP